MNTNVVVQAAFAGLVNHLLFHYFEPSPANTPLATLLLLLQPSVLAVEPFNAAVGSFSFHQLWSTLAVTYITFFLTLASSITVYRLSPFHPLANVPGPVVMKISKAYLLWISIRGERYLVFKELHERYGDVVRTGPNEISVCEVQAMTHVLGSSGLQKGKAYAVRQSNKSIPQSLVVASEPSLHDKKRILWNHGMSMQALKDYEVAMLEKGRELVEQLRRREGKEINFVQWINYFTFDFMSEMAFGGGSNMLQEGKDTQGMWDILEQHAKIMDALAQVPWLSHFVYKVFNFPFAKVGASWAMARVKKGNSGETGLKDLWWYMTSENNSDSNENASSTSASTLKPKLTLPEIASEGVVAILGGSDTTSSILACLFWLLLVPENRGWYERVRDEVDRVFGSDVVDMDADWIEDLKDTKKRSELKVLSACINETLRLFPPLLSNGPREVTSAKDERIVAGHFLPKGTEIYVPPYVIHRNPAHFSDPDSFVPERWLVRDKDQTEERGNRREGPGQVVFDPEGSTSNPLKPNTNANFTHNPLAYIPFSYGPRNCVGRALARQEMLVVAALLIKEFEFEFAPGWDWKSWLGKLRDHWVTVRGELKVVVRVRDRKV